MAACIKKINKETDKEINVIKAEKKASQASQKNLDSFNQTFFLLYK